MASNTNRTRNQRVVLSRITLHFADGQTTDIDPSKVDIVDIKTKQPLFDRVIEGEKA